MEVLRTAAAGWRRPFTVWLDSSSCFTVVLLKERQLKILSRPASSPSVEPPAKTMHACMHAKCAPHSGDDRDSDNNASVPVEGNAVEGLQPPAVEETMHARALVLMPPHHGKMVHACACLQLSADQVAVVTASEDGSVRVISFRFAHLLLLFVLCS